MILLPKIKERLTALALIGFGVALLSLPISQAWAKSGSNSKRSLSQRLYTLAGYGKERQILSQKKVSPDMLTRPRLLGALGLSDEHVSLINDVYDGTFRARDFYNQKLKKIQTNYNRRHVNKSIRFLRSAVGRKFVRLNTAKLKKSKKAYRNFLNNIIKKFPDNDRLKLFDQLEAALQGVDFMIEYEASVLQLTNPMNGEFNAPHADILVSRLRQELRDRFRSWLILKYMYDYKSLSNRELKKLVAFFESPAGKWLVKVDHAGNQAGFATVNRRALRRLEKKLTSMEEGKQNMETTKSVFAPGVRYMFAEKRDPFNPLVAPDKKKKKKKKSGGPGKGKAKKSDETTVQALTTKIDGLPAIPYELYQRIKESNPRLYSDLEYYGALFKNKKGLANLKKSELKDEIKQYHKLIKKAREATELLVQTPLQADLGQLRLAGVIWDPKETVGLIETPDKKGHTIRVGSFVGPDFGVVQSIDQERVVVLEQLRKYDGNIVTQTKFIEFPKPDEEE